MIQLDQQQFEAVHAEGKKVLVLSGAGSGKTRVIVERISYLVEEKKVSPFEILALTFTRKSAGELRTRIEERVGDKANHIAIGTIHAIALNLLHRFGDLVGIKSRSITVYGGFEEEFLIKEIAIDLGLYKKHWCVPKQEIYSMLNAYYSKGEEPKEIHRGYTLFKELLSRCRENNSMTYGMLLTAMMELVPKIKDYLKWKHIFIDEVQDCDPLQFWIVEQFPKLLGASTFAVGDDSQSIYRFRGACPEYLLKNQDQFDIYKLENNYRSVPEIVEASNKLIENNLERIPKTMKATRPEEEGKSIRTMWKCDSLKLSQYINDLINFHKIEPAKIVVLSRIHVLLDKLSAELTALQVPHVKIGRKTALVESEEFRRFHAFLKLLVNNLDNFTFLLIRDLIGVSRETYNEIRLHAVKNSMSHFQAWAGDVANLYNPFVDFFLKHGGAIETSFVSIVADILSLRQNTTSLDQNEVYDFIYAWMDKNPDGSLSAYLEWLATWDIQNEVEDNTDKVQLMTVHAAKGLEFPVVIVAGCNEGILPSQQAINSGDIEEERRLMYVACTRAKDNLILTIRPERYEDGFGRVKENPVSRFIKEIKADD